MRRASQFAKLLYKNQCFLLPISGTMQTLKDVNCPTNGGHKMAQYQVAGSLITSREAAIRAAIEHWAGDTPPSEWTEDQILEWLPGWCRAPEGVDQAELDAEVVQTAIAMMHARTVHCECGEYTGERCIWIGSPEETGVVEYMP